MAACHVLAQAMQCAQAMNARARSLLLPLAIFAGCGTDPLDEEIEVSPLEDREITAACPNKALLKWGLHPEASDRLRCIGITADQISQTIGSAAASAGYHAQDGTASGQPYTAAIDIRTAGRTESQIRSLLSSLGAYGFAAWYRKPGSDGWPASEAPHIHAVYAGCAMKSALDGQVSDYRNGLNGLASHTRYTFWSASAETKTAVYNLWNRFN